MVVPLRSQVRLRLSRLSVQHGRSASSHRPALTLARCSVAAHCALLRVLATPALRASDVRKLTRGAPCFTGLIDGYCSHWLRRLFRPHWGLRTGLRFAGPVFRGCGRPLGVSSPLHPFGASTATACFAHSACSSCAPLVNPSVAATPRHLPLHKGGSGVVLLTAIVPLTKRLPLIPRGAVGVSRLRGLASDQSIIRSSTSISSTSGLRSALPRAS